MPANSVKERLKCYLVYKGISARQFTIRIGVSESFVTNMRVSMHPDKLASIAKEFPDLNTEWLMTGEGDMLKIDAVTEEEEFAQSETANQKTVEISAEAWDVIKKQANSLASKDRQIDELIALLKKDSARLDIVADSADVSEYDLAK